LYTKEIDKIAKNLVILEGIKEVIESKIFVDEKAIRNNELKETKNNFIRYVDISDLITKVPLFLIDLVNNKKILINLPLKKYNEEELEKSKLAEELKFELFKELFLKLEIHFFLIINTA
jgi:hypothetical protein